MTKPLFRKVYVSDLREGDLVRDRRMRGAADTWGVVSDVEIYEVRTLVRFKDGKESIMLSNEPVFLVTPVED